MYLTKSYFAINLLPVKFISTIIEVFYNISPKFNREICVLDNERCSIFGEIGSNSCPKWLQSLSTNFSNSGMLNRYLSDLNFALEFERSRIFKDLLEEPSAKVRTGLFLFIKVPVRKDDVLSIMPFLPKSFSLIFSSVNRAFFNTFNSSVWTCWLILRIFKF